MSQIPKVLGICPDNSPLEGLPKITFVQRHVHLHHLLHRVIIDRGSCTNVLCRNRNLSRPLHLRAPHSQKWAPNTFLASTNATYRFTSGADVCTLLGRRRSMAEAFHVPSSVVNTTWLKTALFSAGPWSSDSAIELWMCCRSSKSWKYKEPTSKAV